MRRANKFARYTANFRQNNKWMGHFVKIISLKFTIQMDFK